MEALNRHRGNVGHQMVVGNVNVSDGGQAIVGLVTQPAPGNSDTEMTQKESNELTNPPRRGWLKNGNPRGDPNTPPRCGAKTRRGMSGRGNAQRQMSDA